MSRYLKLRPVKKDKRNWGFLVQKLGSMTGCWNEVSNLSSLPLMEVHHCGKIAYKDSAEGNLPQ